MEAGIRGEGGVLIRLAFFDFVGERRAGLPRKKSNLVVRLGNISKNFDVNEYSAVDFMSRAQAREPAQVGGGHVGPGLNRLA